MVSPLPENDNTRQTASASKQFMSNDDKTPRRNITPHHGQAFGKTFKKLNLLKLIGEMEHDQELADKLETINISLQEENARKDMVRQAISECHAEIKQHLVDFLQQRKADDTNPFAPTYEDWIADLHPENVLLNKEPGMLQIDLRFYVQDSDHRLLWNEMMVDSPRRQVAVRSYHEHEMFAKQNDFITHAKNTDFIHDGNMEQDERIHQFEQQEPSEANLSCY